MPKQTIEISQDKRIAELETFLKFHFGKCKINRGREDIRIFYGNNRFKEISKSELPDLTNNDIVEKLRES